MICPLLVRPLLVRTTVFDKNRLIYAYKARQRFFRVVDLRKRVSGRVPGCVLGNETRRKLGYKLCLLIFYKLKKKLMISCDFWDWQSYYSPPLMAISGPGGQAEINFFVFSVELPRWKVFGRKVTQNFQIFRLSLSTNITNIHVYIHKWKYKVFEMLWFWKLYFSFLDKCTCNKCLF